MSVFDVSAVFARTIPSIVRQWRRKKRARLFHGKTIQPTKWVRAVCGAVFSSFSKEAREGVTVKHGWKVEGA